MLKEQNELLQRHNNELLQVITWSLTFAAVFLIGVLGLIGFFTTRRYDQEKEALRSHLDGQVATTMAQVEGRLNEKAETFRTAQEASAKELREALRGEAENAASRAVNPLLVRAETAERRVAYLEIDFAREQAKMWDDSKVPTNALRGWAKVVRLANGVDLNYVIAEGLDEIQRLLTAGTSVDAQDATKLHSILGTLPDEYQPVVIKIKRLL